MTVISPIKQDEGIYLIFYGPNGEYLYGRTPSSFSGEDYLTMDELREVGSSFFPVVCI